jgi:hypothetical protein
MNKVSENGKDNFGLNVMKSIATTFAVYNNHYNTIRLAESYQCKHLPWYKINIVPKEEIDFYIKNQEHSS